MKTLLFVTTALILFLVVATILLKAKTAGRTTTTVKDLRPKSPLTQREQSMFSRLTTAFPEHVVLSQVAFSALLTTKQQATRNGFDRKVADFVLCKKSFEVLAVIELDDSSHKNREKEDAARDALLTTAGYRVVRYPQIPDEVRLLADFLAKP